MWEEKAGQKHSNMWLIGQLKRELLSLLLRRTTRGMHVGTLLPMSLPPSQWGQRIARTQVLPSAIMVAALTFLLLGLTLFRRPILLTRAQQACLEHLWLALMLPVLQPCYCRKIQACLCLMWSVRFRVQPPKVHLQDQPARTIPYAFAQKKKPLAIATILQRKKCLLHTANVHAESVALKQLFVGIVWRLRSMQMFMAVAVCVQ